MNEHFLYYVWQYRLFNENDLTTSSSSIIEIIHPGFRNNSSGPDFDMSKIKINGLLWVGRVEIHVNTSDWYKHRHQENPDFDQLVLHVVWNHDVGNCPNNIPVLELKGRVNKSLLNKYQDFQEVHQRVICSSHLEKLDNFIVSTWLERMLVERLLKRKELHDQWLDQTSNDWTEVAYRSLLQAFGTKFNKLAFEQLAIRLPYRIILANRYRPDLVKSLLFGVAGLIDRYPGLDIEEVRMNWQHLQFKYKLESMPFATWKFGRIRPQNQPSNRLLQLSQLLINASLLTYWREELMKKLKEPIENRFFTTDQQSLLSSNFRRIILINAILPVLFSYATSHDDEQLKTVCVEAFYQLKAEKNSVTKLWNSLPLVEITSAESQALMQLTSQYCDLKKCLSCAIGRTVLAR
jgi:hypothetical protein